MADKYGTSTSGSYSWLPGFVRKFLNLDDELPGYGPSSGPPAAGYSAPSGPPAVRPAPSYSAPGYTAPSGPPAARPAPSYTAPTPSYTAPTYQSAGSEPGSYRMSSGAGAEGPETAAPRPEGAPAPGTTLPATSVPPGSVQPIGYAIRSFARGALPPQGLEQFTREARGTFTDVWKFYSYWTRFQTDELFHMAGEFLNAVLPGRRTGTEGGNGGREAPRRIRVTTANGEEKKVEPVAATSAPRAPAAAAAPPRACPPGRDASAMPERHK